MAGENGGRKMTGEKWRERREMGEKAAGEKGREKYGGRKAAAEKWGEEVHEIFSKLNKKFNYKKNRLLSSRAKTKPGLSSAHLRERAPAMQACHVSSSAKMKPGLSSPPKTKAQFRPGP